MRPAPYVANPALASPTLRLRRYLTLKCRGFATFGGFAGVCSSVIEMARADAVERPAYYWVAVQTF